MTMTGNFGYMGRSNFLCDPDQMACWQIWCMDVMTCAILWWLSV